MKLPGGRKDAVREAWAVVRDEIAELSVAVTEPFFDRETGRLFTLVVSPAACTGCGICVAACEPGALAAVADDAERSAEALARWRFGDALPADADAVELARGSG